MIIKRVIKNGNGCSVCGSDEQLNYGRVDGKAVVLCGGCMDAMELDVCEVCGYFMPVDLVVSGVCIYCEEAE